MARCKVYEIKGTDAVRTAGAVRCVRDGIDKVTVDGKQYPICKKHQTDRWHLFVHDRWLYAVDRSGRR